MEAAGVQSVVSGHTGPVGTEDPVSAGPLLCPVSRTHPEPLGDPVHAWPWHLLGGHPWLEAGGWDGADPAPKHPALLALWPHHRLLPARPPRTSCSAPPSRGCPPRPPPLPCTPSGPSAHHPAELPGAGFRKCRGPSRCKSPGLPMDVTGGAGCPGGLGLLSVGGWGDSMMGLQKDSGGGPLISQVPKSGFWAVGRVLPESPALTSAPRPTREEAGQLRLNCCQRILGRPACHL